MTDINIEKVSSFGCDKYVAMKLFLAHVKTVLSSVATNLFGEFGLLGHVLPEAEYLALPNIQVAFQLLPRPVLPPNNTAEQHRTFQDAKSDFELQEKVIGTVKRKFIDALDAEDRIMLQDANGPTHITRSVAWMFAQLHAHYCQLLGADIERFRAKLLKTYDPSLETIPAYLGRTRAIFAEMAANQATVSEFEKIRYIKESLYAFDEAHFAHPFRTFYTNHANTQDQTFTHLENILGPYARNFPHPGTTSSAGFTQLASAVGETPVEQRLAALERNTAAQVLPATTNANQGCPRCLTITHTGWECRTIKRERETAQAAREERRGAANNNKGRSARVKPAKS